MNARPRTAAATRRPRPWWGRALACALALLVLPAPAPAQETGRIGYVDMKRLIDESPQIRAARERLRLEFDARSAALERDMARLASMDARLADPAAALGGPERSALQRDADTLRRSIERTRQRLQQELAQRTDEEIERTWPLIDEAVAEFARDAGLDLVVQSPQVFVSGRIDITERVLERLKRDASQAQAERP